MTPPPSPPTINDSEDLPPLPQYTATPAHDAQTLDPALAAVLPQLGINGSTPSQLSSNDAAKGEGEDAAGEEESHRTLVHAYFTAISRGNISFTASLLRADTLTPQTRNASGSTPLLAAVGAGHTHMVRYLLDIGACIDAYGVIATDVRACGKRGGSSLRLRRRRSVAEETLRTPLQYAAQLGYLPIVKLLVERGADDALVAPDGQLALRLAASGGHREVVEYLPSRRGGGYRRWKAKHRMALWRCEDAGVKIYKFVRIFVWTIPKGVLWDLPRYCLFEPLVKRVKWLGKHYREIPGLFAKAGRDAVESMRKAPEALRMVVKAIPKMLKSLFECVAEIVKYIWKCVTRIPRGLKVVAIWLWTGIKSIAGGIGNILAAVTSFVHTTCAALLSKLKGITLADVGRAFAACIKAIFYDAPLKIWKWLCTFGEASYKAIGKTFGLLGKCVWWIIGGILSGILYVPKKLFDILKACGSSMQSGGKEILVWIDPKRA